MNVIVNHLFAVFIQLGAFGLLIVGALDDSFLFTPLGNDLLMVALTARNHRMLPVYAAMASAGSVIGCLLIDWVSRNGGEKGLDKLLSGRELNYVKRKVENNAGWALSTRRKADLDRSSSSTTRRRSRTSAMRSWRCPVWSGSHDDVATPHR